MSIFNDYNIEGYNYDDYNYYKKSPNIDTYPIKDEDILSKLEAFLHSSSLNRTPEEILDSIDINIIEQYLRKKKLEKLNKKFELGTL